MIKAVGESIIVIRDSNPTHSPGGIILPKDEMPQGSGIVVSVGRDALGFSVGQRLLYKRLDGEDFKYNGKTHVRLKPHNIIGVYSDE